MAPSSPFHVGATSFTIEASLVENIRFLAGMVDDVELILFDCPEGSNLPGLAELDELARLARKHRLSYTLHLPNDADLGHPDAGRRKESIVKCLRGIELTRPLQPAAFIAHFHGERRGDDPSDDIPAWSQRCEQSMREILASGVPPAAFCAETLDYPFELIAPVVDRIGLSVCLDVGHLAMTGQSLETALLRYWSRTKVVHLHGIRDGHDHRDVGGLAPEWRKRLMDQLSHMDGNERIVTIEVFSSADLLKSLDILHCRKSGAAFSRCSPAQ